MIDVVFDTHMARKTLDARRDRTKRREEKRAAKHGKLTERQRSQRETGGPGGLSTSCLAFFPAFAVTAVQDGFGAVMVDLVMVELRETGGRCQAALQHRAMCCFLSAKCFYERDVNGSV